mmetsp:Transcript_42364/g.95875  ORF Transcript_42364/g.95875 Transcript_42364/m.95875 type:complete len:262 (-) Transcript_42364:70-855(-)
MVAFRLLGCKCRRDRASPRVVVGQSGALAQGGSGGLQRAHHRPRLGPRVKAHRRRRRREADVGQVFHVGHGQQRRGNDRTLQANQHGHFQAVPAVPDHDGRRGLPHELVRRAALQDCAHQRRRGPQQGGVGRHVRARRQQARLRGRRPKNRLLRPQRWKKGARGGGGWRGLPLRVDSRALLVAGFGQARHLLHGQDGESVGLLQARGRGRGDLRGHFWALRKRHRRHAVRRHLVRPSPGVSEHSGRALPLGPGCVSRCAGL